MISTKPQVSPAPIEQAKPHLTHQQIYEQILQRAKEEEIVIQFLIIIKQYFQKKKKEELKVQKKNKRRFKKQKYQKITPLPSKLIKSANVVTTRTTIDTEKPSSISLSSMNAVHEIKPPQHQIVELDDQTIVESILIQEVPQAVSIEEKVEEHPQYTSLKVIGEEKRKGPQLQEQQPQISTLKRVPEETHFHPLPHDERTLKTIEMRKYLIEKYTPHPQHKYTPEPVRQNIVHKTAPPVKQETISSDKKIEISQSAKKIEEKKAEKPIITIQLKSAAKMQEQKAAHTVRPIPNIPLKQVQGTWQQPIKPREAKSEKKYSAPVKEQPKVVSSQLVQKNVVQQPKKDLASSIEFDKRKQQRDLAPQKYDVKHQIQKPINVLHAEQMLNKQKQQEVKININQLVEPRVQEIQKDVQDKIKKIIEKKDRPFLRVHQRYYLQPKKPQPPPVESIMNRYLHQVQQQAQQGVIPEKNIVSEKKVL